MFEKHTSVMNKSIIIIVIVSVRNIALLIEVESYICELHNHT